MEQRQLPLEHGQVGDAMEQERIQQPEECVSTPPDLPTPSEQPPVAEKPASPEKIIEKPATPKEVVDNPTPSEQPLVAEETAAAETCNESVVPKMVRAYEKDATPEVQAWFKKTAA